MLRQAKIPSPSDKVFDENNIEKGACLYLAKLSIEGFRKLNALELSFRPGLNVLVGPNNVGKTAIVDALRALLSASDDGALRLSDFDLHMPLAGECATQVTFRYVFSDLSEDDEADFLTALKPIPGTNPQAYEVHVNVRYTTVDAGGRLRVKRWCGDHEENAVTTEMLEDLRAVYLPPLRDSAQGLKPNRSSQLARLLHRLSTEANRDAVVELVKQLDTDLQKAEPIAGIQKAITERHNEMLGAVLKQNLSVQLSSPDFQRIAARLGLSVGSLEIEQNGLGYNNLIYMAVVLSELSLNQDAAYKALIVEEPEAHLHPQLQAVLLQYLQSKETPKAGEKVVQVFVTSHSPHFASLANIDAIGCIHHGTEGIRAFFPREVDFEPKKKAKLQRYLDVTRADLLFARRIIFVEGAAELFMMQVLAAKLELDLRKHSVSVLSTDGLNFDAFLPLFAEKRLNVRVAVISDGDPKGYPRLGDSPLPSATAQSLKAMQNSFIQVNLALKTFEYDLALHECNRPLMLAALSDLHPEMAKELGELVKEAHEDDKARVLFSGMFERGETKANVQKGAYGQVLAQRVAEAPSFAVPEYIKAALRHVCAA